MIEAALSASTPFASTIGGYITSIATPIIAILVGAAWRGAMSRLKEQDKAMTATNQALAVLLSEHGQVMVTSASTVQQVNSLTTATAVLSSRLDDHVRDAVWKQQAGLTEHHIAPAQPGERGSNAVRD